MTITRVVVAVGVSIGLVAAGCSKGSQHGAVFESDPDTGPLARFPGTVEGATCAA